ncbi:NAD(P)-dependent oxidoreductase [Nitratireductor sp. ZSWI3]|uniref:NAD(P)-dependent oxidoreductase n=1 Tax=Nitratireductor sp. ZSWI3 TaxID=2966359 RepID=UPI0021502C21|nr:NAD(P)-dependent oxidoreductase [Nitratireductor sp. ZSWI3]MCR4267205.1 dehydrogenase [Nitratireductor sp. ZSWI3]
MRIVLDPEPRTAEEIFSPADHRYLLETHDVAAYPGGSRDAFYADHLPGCDILISQQPMDTARLETAPRLKAIFNVETNFLPNIDYPTCFARGIHVLAPSGVFALPVAEMGLGMALSLARGIHSEHKLFLDAEERYGLEGNHDAELMTGSQIGFVGFGDLGRALHALLPGFRPAAVRVFDPWLPDAHLQRLGVTPASLEEVLAKSRFVFVVAAITTENAHLLNAGNLALMQDGASLILLSRAAVADFDAVAALTKAGRIRFATDVFPKEPVDRQDPIRTMPNTLFSPHRAGALHSALKEIGRRVIEDIGQIEKGLPPISCRRAERETVMRLRSKPIEKT